MKPGTGPPCCETAINDVAERADVAPRTVTVHFPAKEQMLFDAAPFTLDGLSKRLRARPHESALDIACRRLA
jgi:AcrR family transcriptional regulator